MTNIWFISW